MAPERRVLEHLDVHGSPSVVIGATPLGRIAITTCRDFLDMDLRVALKNADPPVDIVRLRFSRDRARKRLRRPKRSNFAALAPLVDQRRRRRPA